MALEYTFTKEANSNVSVAILDTENNVTTYKSFMMQNVQNVTYNPAADNVVITFDGKSVLTLTAAEVTTPNTANSQALWDALQTTYFFKPTVGAGSGFTLANNGVSDFGGTTVQLGGSLIQNTTIAAGANNLAVTATTGTVSTDSTSGGNIATTSQTATQIQTAVTDGTNIITNTQTATQQDITYFDGVKQFTKQITAISEYWSYDGNDRFLMDNTNDVIQFGSLSTQFKILGTFQVPIATVAIDTTLNTTHYTVLVDASGANRTITLPAAAGCSGRIYNIKKIDATANTVTIDGNGAETIDGVATKVISAQWTNITIQSNGTAWFIL